MWKIRVNPTRNPIDPNPFSTRLKWPVTRLIHDSIDPTRPFCHVYYLYYLSQFCKPLFGKGFGRPQK